MKAVWPVGRRLFGPEGQLGGGLGRCGAGQFGMGRAQEVTAVMETGSMGTVEMWASVEVMSTTETGQPGAQGWAVHRRISQGEEEEDAEVVWSVVVVLGEAWMCEQGGGSAGRAGGWNARPA